MGEGDVDAYDVREEKGKKNSIVRSPAKYSYHATVSLQGSKKGEMVDQKFVRQYLHHPDGSIVWAHPTGKF